MLENTRQTSPESINRGQKEVDRIQALIDRAGGFMRYMMGAAAIMTAKDKQEEG